MEQQILNAEIHLTRQQRGLWLIDDAASAERAERLRLAIRRQAEILVAQQGEQKWAM
jgi:poly-gamma-glutamate capsule biosynthesis protein CapA/YwtB (metallophosphatase superfamily)